MSIYISVLYKLNNWFVGQSKLFTFSYVDDVFSRLIRKLLAFSLEEIQGKTKGTSG